MKIIHVHLSHLPIPPHDYGGTERIVWALSLGQAELGHEVRFLVKNNPDNHPNAQRYNPKQTLEQQIQGWADIIHFHWPYDGALDTPYVCTQHGNRNERTPHPQNTIFLSAKHAALYDADCFVYNGLYWPDYGEADFRSPRNGAHFLAKAMQKSKNLRGSVRIARQAGLPLHILGGKRFNLKSNPYAYLGRDLHFYGMVGGKEKLRLINQSQALLFPVLWHEPFGLAVIESLYLGCPVIASPFGALPELVNEEVGFLSTRIAALADALRDNARFNRRACHEYAKTHFNHQRMAADYLQCYERVLDGETLNRNVPIARHDVLMPLILDY